MSTAKKVTKIELHPKNKHRGQYDFERLVECYPELSKYLKQTAYSNTSIDFFNPNAVKALNKSILKCYYNINFWDIPPNYLCPPIPGRADYIHYAADLIAGADQSKVSCLDLGVGASCVYPIIGNAEYGWSFIGSDIDQQALASSQKIIEKNASLNGKVELRLQLNNTQLLKGVIKKNESIDLVICNPPFHASAAEAKKAATKKLRNLSKKKVETPLLNFGGQQNELWCPGGEFQLVKNLIHESSQFSENCKWFTSLISKSQHLKPLLAELEKVNPTKVKIIAMQTGNKISRILSWSFDKHLT